jgi:hypothetical protein
MRQPSLLLAVAVTIRPSLASLEDREVELLPMEVRRIEAGGYPTFPPAIQARISEKRNKWRWNERWSCARHLIQLLHSRPTETEDCSSIFFFVGETPLATIYTENISVSLECELQVRFGKISSTCM